MQRKTSDGYQNEGKKYMWHKKSTTNQDEGLQTKKQYGEEKYLDDIESKTILERERTGQTSLKEALSVGVSLSKIFSELAKGIVSFIRL